MRSALIRWIFIVKYVLEINIVYGNNQVVVIVPMHIKKLHHTKTVYKIIKKPVHVRTDRPSNGQRDSTEENGIVRYYNNITNDVDANSDDSARWNPVGRGTAIRSGPLDDKRLKMVTHDRDYRYAEGYRYGGYWYRDGFTRTLPGYHGDGFPNPYYDGSQRDQNGMAVVHADHLGENKLGTGYRVQEDISDFDRPNRAIHVKTFPHPSATVDRNNNNNNNNYYYSTLSYTGSRDSLDGMSSVTAVTVPPQIIENVYYTLDPVVPYETARRLVRA